MKKSSLKFSNPVLSKFNFSLDGKPASPEDNGNLDTRYTVNVIASSDNNSIVELEAEISGVNNGISFTISTKIGARFSWGGEADTNIDILLKQNAPALLLSYLRPLISTMTTYSPAGLVMLPFVNFKE